VEEEHRHSQEHAPIPSLLTVEKAAVDWDQLRRLFHAMNSNAVRTDIVSVIVVYFVNYLSGDID